jgi:hypothetical protein
MGLPSRTLPAAAAVVVGLALVWVLTSMFPGTGFSIQSATDPVVPVWEPSDEEQAKKQSKEDTPTPTLSPTPAQSSTLEAPEMANDPLTSEAVETALRGSFDQELKQPNEGAERDEPLRGAFGNPAGRPAGPVLPKVGSPSPEPSSLGNTITYSQDPAQQTWPEPYADATAQPVPTQALPPDLPTGAETLPQPPADLPTEAETTPHPPQAGPADADTFSQPPPHQDATASDLPAEPLPPLTEDLAKLE